VTLLKTLNTDATFDLTEIVDKITLVESTKFSLNIDESDIVSFSRVGKHLVLMLANGEVIYIEEYYTFDPPSQLFISKDGDMERVDINDTSEDGTLYVTYTSVSTVDSSISSLVFSDVFGAGLIAASTAAGLGGLVAAVALTNGSSNSANDEGPDLGAALGEGPTVSLVLEDVISGTGIPGQDIQIDTDGDGVPDLFTTVDSSGNWSAVPTTPLVDGSFITATTVDENGLQSPPVVAQVQGVPVAPTIDVANGSEISGTAEPGSEIEVTVGGVVYTTTATEPDGEWSVSPKAPDTFDTGEEISVTAIGENGNSSESSTETVDATAPETPVIEVANGSEVSGTAEPGSEIEVTVGGVVYTTTATEPDGEWSVSPEAPDTFDTGEEVSVTAIGENGNSSESATETVDATAPDAPNAPTDYSDNEGDFQDANSTAASTDDTTPAINVGAGLTDTPKLYVDGVEVEAIYDPAVGTLTPVAPLAEGSHELTYTLADEAGNESAESGALPIEVDSTAPTAPAAPTDYADDAGAEKDTNSTAGTTDDTTPGINIGAGLTETPTLYVDGIEVDAIYDPALGTLTPVTPLAEGSYELNYTLTDEAGNESAESGALPIEIDSTAPTAPAAPTDYADDAGAEQDANSTAATTDDTTPGINVGAGLSDTPKLYVDGVEVDAIYDPAAGTLTPVAPLAEGSHELTYTLTDETSNESAESGVLPIEIDTTAPAEPVTSTDYADDVGSVQDANSTAFITDDTTPGINIGAGLTEIPTLYVDGVEVDATYDPVLGTLTPVTPLTEGPHELTSTLTDAAGNESAESEVLPIEVDATAPTTPAAPTDYADDVGDEQDANSTAATTDDTTPGINVGAGLTDTPKLYVDGVEVDAIYDPIVGTLTPVTPLAEGSHDLTYTLTHLQRQ